MDSKIFCTLKTEGQGILEATNMFPGIITSLTGIIQIKSIFQMFSQENGTDGHDDLTNGKDTAYIRITSVHFEQQTILPSGPLWEALGNVATQGGGIAKTPSYPIVIEDNMEGPRSFGPGLTSMLFNIVGREVPDHLDVIIRANRNVATRSGNEAYHS